MKRNKSYSKQSYSVKLKSIVIIYTTLVLSTCVDCTSETNIGSGSVQPKDSSQGRQLTSTNYDQQRMKPMQVASSRDATVSNSNYMSPSAPTAQAEYNNVAFTDPQQLHYSPSAAANAYYYYHYPNNKPWSYGGGGGSNYGAYNNGVGLGMSDYSNPKTVSVDPETGGFFDNFIRDLLPAPEADSKTDPITITGLASLVVSSLSGLSWIAIGALVLLGAPIFIPLIISPLIFLGLLLYFIPVVRLDIPGDVGGRALSIWKHLDTTAHFYKRIAQNDECIERISCEVARFAKGNMFEDWITKKIEKSTNKWLHRVSRSWKAAQDGHNCHIYSCNPKLQLRKVIGSNNVD